MKSGQLKDNDQVGIAGHILDFRTDDAPAQPAVTAAPTTTPTAPAPATPVKDPLPESKAEQIDMLKKSLGLGIITDGKSAEPVVGIVRVIAGGVNGQSEVTLKDLVTYIGAGDQALIKIKGFMAPDLAAAISRRPEGFFLKAVKAGYPKVNGQAVQEQTLLENGALIEVGGTNFVFYRSDAKKPAEEKK